MLLSHYFLTSAGNCAAQCAFVFSVADKCVSEKIEMLIHAGRWKARKHVFV